MLSSFCYRAYTIKCLDMKNSLPIESINMRNNISIGRKILYFLIYLSFLISMKFWIGWEGRDMYLNWFIGIFSFIIILQNNIKLDFSFTNILLVLCVLLTQLYTGSRFGMWYILGFLPYVTIICLNDKDKIRCWEFITKWYGYLMIPSLIVFILCGIVELPSFGIQNAVAADWAEESGYGKCKNYIFYMQSQFDNYGLRFNGPFLEPGHLGMMGAFLLFGNNFNFKKKGMIPILIAVCFTLSLAGYMLTLIGLVMILFYRKKIRAKHMLICVLGLLGIYNFGVYFNDGDNLINEMILSRLEFDSETGFKGNNRVFGLTEIYYLGLYNDMKLLLYGYPHHIMEWLNENGSRGSGYMVYMCWNGLIGVIIASLLYIIVIFKTKARFFAILSFIFVGFMFWQRCYPMWTSWIICYIYSIVTEERR